MAGVRGGGVAVPRILSKGLPWWCVQRVLVFYQPVVPSENFLEAWDVASRRNRESLPAPVGRLAGTKAKAEAEAEAEAKARCWLRRRLWLI